MASAMSTGRPPWESQSRRPTSRMVKGMAAVSRVSMACDGVDGDALLGEPG